jgi:DNA-binding response OmpR family regulator
VTPDDTSAKPLDVIVVDDDRDTREMMRVSFAAERWVVRDTASLEGALALAHERVPDVLVTDLQLDTKLDGWHLAQAMRADPRIRQVRLILITGHHPGREIVGSFDAHVHKPVSMAELRELVRALAARIRDHQRGA